MCSAMAVNQMTKKLSLRLEINPNETDTSCQWWKRLAYSLFSKRACKRTSLETLALFSVTTMSAADMEAFASVLASDHPEEEICDCLRGAVDESDVMLKEGATIYSEINTLQGRLSAESLIICSSAMRSVRCFSDDGRSELVNALVSGFGRCLVRRDDVLFEEFNDEESASSGVTSLHIGFEQEDDEIHIPTISNGLPRFLEAIGAQLKSLTLDGPREPFDQNIIPRSCPNLEELTLFEYFVDARLNFSEYQAMNQTLPSLNCQWNDISALAEGLGDTNNPLAKCVRRLRVRLINRLGPWGDFPLNYESSSFDTHVHALLQMLEVNRSLEYIDVVVSNLGLYADEFKSHNHQLTTRSIKLETGAKVAFLSVLFDPKRGRDTSKEIEESDVAAQAKSTT